MSSPEIEGGRLFEMYARYVGEPDSRKDVYGYWLFLAGAIVSFFGIVLFLTVATEVARFWFRGLSIWFAGLGLPIALLGIVLLLPIKRWGIATTVLGSMTAIGASFAFAWAYPEHWVPYIAESAPKYDTEIILAYSGGIAVMVGVTVLVPILTGEKSIFLTKEYERTQDHPDVVVGEALRGGLFSVFRGEDEWEWRLIDQEAIAESPVTYLSRLETEESVDRIKAKVKEAGLLEIKHAAFRLYEAAESQWRWVLMGEDGDIIANSDQNFETRNDAANVVNNLKERGPDAEIINIESGGAFVYKPEGSEVHWQLVDDERTVLAAGPTGYASREAAEVGMETARIEAEQARKLTLDGIGIELFDNDDNRWQWRLLDDSDHELARSDASFDSRRNVEEAVYDLLEHIGSAPVIASNQAAFETIPAVGGWEWRLLNEKEQPVARSYGDRSDAQTARHEATVMRDHAAGADVITIDEAEFEYYRAGNGWNWRLVTEHRETLAESTAGFESKDLAAEAIEEIRRMAGEADLIEFENAAFQLYEHGGEWRWRLIDEDGNVMADSGEEHDSRDSAAASMMTIKEQAPEAEVLEIETAAFELFQDENGRWNWRLVDISGEEVAHGPKTYPSRAEAQEAMDRLVDAATASEVRSMESAAFHIYTDEEGDWRWWFVNSNGDIIGEAIESYATRDETVTAIDTMVRPVAGNAEIHTIERLALQIIDEENRYGWRVLDETRDTIATSSRSYTDRGIVEQEIDLFREQADQAIVFEISEPTFQLLAADAGWEWRLVDVDRDPTLTSPGRYETRQAASDAVDDVREVIEEAEILDYDGAAFELFETTEGAWKWQLVDEDGETMASSAAEYETETTARDGLDQVRSELEDASILEIEIAAFELQEDGGNWSWRLIDETGNPIAESIIEYDSRTEARESMEMLQEYAPTAQMNVAE